MSGKADKASPSSDHRTAIAERNVEAICDAAERLFQRGVQPNMAAVAAESGLSRVTVYAHFPTMQQLVEAVARRAIQACVVAFDAADADTGDPVAALERIASIGWLTLDRASAIAQATAHHLPAERRRRLHEPILLPIRKLIERGQSEGVFRTDTPPDWLVACFYALIHAAADEVQAGRLAPASAHDILVASLLDVVQGQRSAAAAVRQGRRV